MLLSGVGAAFRPAKDTQQVFAVLAALLDLKLWQPRNPATAKPFELTAVSCHRSGYRRRIYRLHQNLLIDRPVAGGCCMGGC
jgi:hypothetical protein